MHFYWYVGEWKLKWKMWCYHDVTFCCVSGNAPRVSPASSDSPWRRKRSSHFQWWAQAWTHWSTSTNLPVRNHLFHILSRFELFYRPQTKFEKVMFSQVSVCPQGGCLPHPLWADTPWADTPSGRHPRAVTPLPSACWNTINKRAVRIPLECILVVKTSIHNEQKPKTF